MLVPRACPGAASRRCAQPRGRSAVERGERRAHPSRADESRVGGDIGHREIRLVEEPLGALNAQRSRDLGWRRAEMLGEEPREVSRSDAHSLRERLGVRAIESAALDQPQRTLNSRLCALPGWAERCGLRPTAEAGAEASVLGSCRGRIDAHVPHERQLRRTNRAAVNLRRQDCDEESPVRRRVAPQHRVVTNREIEHARGVSAA